MSFIIYPIGDSAATIELGTVINETVNRKVIAMQTWLQQQHAPAIKEIVIAYSSLSVYYELLEIKKLTAKGETAFQYISKILEQAFYKCAVNEQEENLIKIPVCYHPSLGLDLQYISEKKSLNVEEVIQLHLAKTYRVYMIGFLPGFPYMAEVDERIAIERRAIPRAFVPKGSVGIAGTQTGIYPLESPGGWQLIGRTPFKLFDQHSAEVVGVKAGDHVRFSRISLDEFHQLNN